MSLDLPEFQLKHTNVSRPLLSHQNSLQSIAASQAASEGYYSLHSSSEGSGASNAGSSSRLTPGRTFYTPPSHRTPAQSHEQLLQSSPDAPVTHLKGFGIPRQAAAQPRSTVSTIAEERPDSRTTRTPQRRAEMDSESLATTPGMDETPYIRFAIDQLTRDEEVRGTRMYPLGAPVEEADYPVERVVSDDGLGYMQKEKEWERRMSSQAPAAVPRSKAMPQAPRVPQPLPQPASKPPLPSQPIQPLPPVQPVQPAPRLNYPESTHQKDVFVSASLPHAPLRFLPAILRPLWLGIFILLCIAMLAALIFSVIYSKRSDKALWAYQRFGDGRYFIFEYLPTILGMLVLMWLFQVQIALQRIVPFISMASGSFHQRSQASFLELYPTQFLFPKLEYFRAGLPLVGVFYLAAWLFQWTVPLLASSFNVRWDPTERVWRWVAVQSVLWAAAALYVLLLISLLGLLVFLRKGTGLKWDPRSLADIIVLLERSNTMADYKNSDTFENHEFRQRLADRAHRIGYWSTTRRPNDVFHGIGEEGGEPRRYSLENGRIHEKGPEPQDATQQRSGDFSIRMDLRSPRLRLRYLPWYLRESAVIAWTAAMLALFVAFVVISYLNSAVRFGFLPKVDVRTDAAGFSASNFLYSFVPAVIGQLLFLILLSFDYTLRALRPYIALSAIGGATAETSLLVDYAARLPLSSTAAALENGHYQNAVLSFISLCSATLPVLAGGCFWTQYYADTDIVRVAADLPAYYALCFFLALYCVALFFVVPGRRRARLPHRAASVAEVTSWLYQSAVLTDRAFARPQTKAELVTRLMGSAYVERSWAQSLTSLVRPSRANLRGEEGEKAEKEKEREKQRGTDKQAPKHKQAHELSIERHNSIIDPGKIRYGFGIHVGRDGLEHLGIDRVRRGGERSGRELVIYEEQRRQSRGEEV